MKFDYLRQPGGISLPAIRIQIRLPSDTKSIGYWALIDSGADFCTFPHYVANEIGIANLRSKQFVDVGGISGQKIRCYFHAVSLQIGGTWYTFDVGFSEQYDNIPLLGRKGFFENFAVYINHAKERIELHPIAKKKPKKK